MPVDADRRTTRIGAAYALGAFGIWGVLPVYFKALAHVPAAELLAHRIVWSLVLLVPMVWLAGRWGDLRIALRSRPARRALMASAALVGANWGLYIWAVNDGRLLETSLGYFINPLLNVALGFAFLGERLSRWQWFAIALAAAGVINQTVALGVLPWVPLAIAGTFAFYGLIRKTAPVDALSGQLVEVIFLAPAALTWLALLAIWGEFSLGAFDRGTDLLILASGIVTTVPLLCFTQAARRLKLSTVGFFQYIGPTGHLLLAVLVYGEDFTVPRMITFGLIWAALAIYTIDARRR